MARQATDVANSRRKGKDGELELSRVLRNHGYDCRRGQQHKGGGDSPDVVGLDGIHIECKRVERLNIEEALAQARRDSERSGNVPVVMHRRNYEPWKVTMDLEQWLPLYEAWRDTMGCGSPVCTPDSRSSPSSKG